MMSFGFAEVRALEYKIIHLCSLHHRLLPWCALTTVYELLEIIQKFKIGNCFISINHENMVIIIIGSLVTGGGGDPASLT